MPPRGPARGGSSRGRTRGSRARQTSAKEVRSYSDSLGRFRSDLTRSSLYLVFTITIYFHVSRWSF